jgi:hypothetical protein
MSFLTGFHNAYSKIDPVERNVDPLWSVIKPKTPPPPPGVPNPNDAVNAAQSQTDAMRMRRGMLSNIYAGSSNQAPVVGKSALGT